MTNVQGFATLRSNETETEINPGFALQNPKLPSSTLSLHSLQNKGYFCFCYRRRAFVHTKINKFCTVVFFFFFLNRETEIAVQNPRKLT